MAFQLHWFLATCTQHLFPFLPIDHACIELLHACAKWAVMLAECLTAPESCGLLHAMLVCACVPIKSVGTQQTEQGDVGLPGFAVAVLQVNIGLRVLTRPNPEKLQEIYRTLGQVGHRVALHVA